jgi:hypothetical protein
MTREALTIHCCVQVPDNVEEALNLRGKLPRKVGTLQ